MHTIMKLTNHICMYVWKLNCTTWILVAVVSHTATYLLYLLNTKALKTYKFKYSCIIIIIICISYITTIVCTKLETNCNINDTITIVRVTSYSSIIGSSSLSSSPLTGDGELLVLLVLLLSSSLASSEFILSLILL